MSLKVTIFVIIKTKFKLLNDKHTWQTVLSEIEQEKLNKNNT